MAVNDYLHDVVCESWRCIDQQSSNSLKHALSIACAQGDPWDTTCVQTGCSEQRTCLTHTCTTDIKVLMAECKPAWFLLNIQDSTVVRRTEAPPTDLLDQSHGSHATRRACCTSDMQERDDVRLAARATLSSVLRLTAGDVAVVGTTVAVPAIRGRIRRAGSTGRSATCARHVPSQPSASSGRRVSARTRPRAPRYPRGTCSAMTDPYIRH